jgi:hypothetical protein
MTRSLPLAIALALAGCVQSHPDPGIPLPGESLTETVGPEGAVLRIDGLEVAFPAGAVAADTVITVTATDETPPAFLDAFSPVIRLEPDGLELAVPVEVRLPFSGDPARASAFWSARGGDAFVARPTRIEGGVAIVESSHFSRVFVGSACSGEGCCDAANGELDVLLQVDSSNSMAEEQALLQAQIPHLAHALATGDSDGDGVQDFPAQDSVRFGVVSPDMGSFGVAVPTCGTGDLGAAYGDDALLRTEGLATGCLASYPAVAELSADMGPTGVTAFVDQVRCVGTLGIGGCGFEQQLESLLKASTPSTSSIRFFGGTTGHGDGANAALFRPDSMLAMIVLTDEDDCSAADPELFDPMSPRYSGSLNLRCFENPGAVHPATRYVDGLLALRSDPADLIYAAITGVPLDAVGTDYAAMLSHPDMIERVDPADPSRLVRSCETAGVGIAYPPRRIVTVASELDAAGAGTVVGSICSPDFTPAIDAILTRVAARARGECS